MTTAQSNPDDFFQRVDSWINASGEVFAVIYHGAGRDIDKQFFTRLDAFRQSCREAPDYCEIIAFRDPQFPLRGIVDDDFIEQALKLIPDGAEAMVLDLEQKHPLWSWNSDFEVLLTGNITDTHAELREELNDWRGQMVAVGLCPPIWEKDSEGIVSIERRKLG